MLLQNLIRLDDGTIQGYLVSDCGVEVVQFENETALQLYLDSGKKKGANYGRRNGYSGYRAEAMATRSYSSARH